MASRGFKTVLLLAALILFLAAPWLSRTLLGSSYMIELIVQAMIFGILALSLVVHRQWSEHEQMTYPLATVATAMVNTPIGSSIRRVDRFSTVAAASLSDRPRKRETEMLIR